MKNEIEVIDNFLPDYYFKQLQSNLLGEYMPWFHNEYITTEDGKLYYRLKQYSQDDNYFERRARDKYWNNRIVR